MSRLVSSERLLVLLAFALFLVSAFFAQDYFQKDERLSELNGDIYELQEELSELQEELSKPEEEVDLEGLKRELEGLKRERDRLEDELASATTTFPKAVQSIEVTNLVYQATRKAGVELMKLEAVGTENKKIGDSTYLLSTFRVQLRAQLSQVKTLLREIEQGRFTTLTTNNLKLSPAPAAWDVLLDVNILSQSE